MLKILYLSNSRLSESVNGVYIRGLKENNVDVESFWVPKGFRGTLSAIKTIYNSKSDFIMIGYDSPILAIITYLVSETPVIYNSLCSVYERLVISRGLVSARSLKAFYYRFLDFWSFGSSDLLMLESNEQIDFCHNFFRVSKNRCICAYTGVDEGKFVYDPNIKKREVFTAIFRGAFLPEAGAELVVEAAKKLESKGVEIIIMGNGQKENQVSKLIERLAPKNLTWLKDFIPQDKLNEIMQSCHVSLGQLSNHPRLDRTIPHKAYESLAMGLPYLTAANRGLLELLKPDETCIVCRPENPDDLAIKILWAKENSEQLQKIANNGRHLFESKLTTAKLGRVIVERLN